MGSNRTRAATLVLIAVLAWIGLGLFTKYYDAFGSQGAVGVFASLVAVGLVGTFGAVFGGRQTVAPPAGERMPGLIRVVAKQDVTPGEWLKLMSDARSEFFLAGHSLGKWCGGTHRDSFEANMIRILKRHGTVTLLMLGPGSQNLERLKRATQRDYTKAVAESREFLHALIPHLTPEQKTRFRVSVLSDHATLPYTLVGNERTIVTAAYLSTRDSDEVPCLEMLRDCQEGISIYDDFCALVKQSRALS